MNRDFQQLRTILDGDDPFMVGGHQKSSLRKKERIVPEWTKNDKKVREVLLRSFPKLRTDPKQRRQAARWARIIHLYFRMQYTYRQVADELDMPLKAMESMIRSIKRVAAGKRANGTGLLGSIPVGRPKKR